jgi:DNA-binding FadR family transcriptional regulator
VSFGPADECALFLGGDDRTTPEGIAWSLESLAVTQGWPLGRSYGTESELMERFGARRDGVRQAVRILQSRGSMRMQRGAKGGLQVVQPQLDSVVFGLTIQLRARGVGARELGDTTALLDSERAIVAALRRGADNEAEQAQRHAHTRLSSLLLGA